MATTTQTEKNVYLIEKSGETRQVWGPYTEAHARREAGVRHALVRGNGLSNGLTMTRGALAAKVQAGSVWSVDGIELA